VDPPSFSRHQNGGSAHKYSAINGTDRIDEARPLSTQWGKGEIVVGCLSAVSVIPAFQINLGSRDKHGVIL
jgi:hypothetical protein